MTMQTTTTTRIIEIRIILPPDYEGWGQRQNGVIALRGAAC
jgi:hypothetical protein